MLLAFLIGVDLNRQTRESKKCWNFPINIGGLAHSSSNAVFYPHPKHTRINKALKTTFNKTQTKNRLKTRIIQGLNLNGDYIRNHPKQEDEEQWVSTCGTELLQVAELHL